MLEGVAGYDALYGGDGKDTLDGGANTDSLTGGDGDDALIGGSSADTLNGGDGIDTASYAPAAEGVDARLLGGGYAGRRGRRRLGRRREPARFQLRRRPLR